MKPEPIIHLTPGKRVLFLTKEPELIRRQLRGEIDLQMKDLTIDDLLDDINTDAMTPAWVCFSHKPEDIARDAYAGLIVDGKRLFEHDALINGNFEVIVSGYRKGVGSSRETATQCEVWSSIRIAVAASFAPIHAGNDINQGLLMANHAMLERLQAGEGLAIDEFCKGYDAITQLIIKEGGLFPFAKAVERGELQVPVPNTPKRPMTMGEKILARHLVGTKSGEQAYVKPGDAVVVEVDGGYTHEFTTAQVHYFLEQTGTLRENVTAKDVMLYILLNYAKPQMTLDRIMEFTGPGLRSLSMDERATLANMATECSARTAVIEADEKTFAWIAAMRPDADVDSLKSRAVSPDPDAEYAGGIHTIDLGIIRPMVAHPGDPDHGIPSDPTNGAFVHEFENTKIDIAYAGSCTAGKVDDFLFYHQVAKEAVDAGLKVAEGVKFYIQFGSQAVETFARENGLLDTFERAGAVVLNPGCGACIGCGPGVSDDSEQVTISAINRNYKGRSGPGKLWLASPLTVAASAFTGRVTAYMPGMFAKQLVDA